MPICPSCGNEYTAEWCPGCGNQASGQPPIEEAPKTNILERWEITVEELTAAIDANPSLRGMMLGYIAEVKLHEFLVINPHVTALLKDDDHNRKKKGDRRIIYKGHEFVIESKSLQTSTVKKLADGTFIARAQCDASDRRPVDFPDGSRLETTCLIVGEFDILAVNVYAFENRWRFVYALNRDLPRSTFKKYSPVQQQHLLASLVPVTYPPTGIFTSDLFSLLDRLIEEKSRS